MKYQRFVEQVLSMNCNKIYKPILILAYLDYIEISDCDNVAADSKVDLDILLPFFMYYIKLDSVVNSGYGIKNFESKSKSALKQIIIDGPLFRVQTDVTIFKAELEAKDYKFGFDTNNPSIDFKLLANELRNACHTLIKQQFNFDIKTHDLTTYKQMVSQIIKTKIDKIKTPKIYKYLVILSYVDYFQDLGLDQLAFKQLIPTEDLFTYYKLYFNIESISEFIKTPAVKDGSDKFIYNHMREFPVRRLCAANTFFQVKQNDSKSRKVENLPTEFGIIINDKFDTNCMIAVVRDITSRMIQHHTAKAIDTNLVYNIKYTDVNPQNPNYRYGQSQYRKSLLERYECTCAICNMDFENILVASHAKPWRDCSTTHQKLSVNNGLLLCKFHDSLFDKGYITFDEQNNYSVKFSKHMTSNSIDQFYSFYDNKIPDYVTKYPKIQTYLKYHHNHIFKQ